MSAGTWRRGEKGLLCVLILFLAACTNEARRRKGGETSEAVATSFNKGVGLLEQYDYIAAYRVFEMLAEKAPDLAAVRFNKGLAAMNLQQSYLETAEADFRSALQIDPKLVHAHFSLGILLHHKQRFAAALESFRRAVELAPDDPYCRYWLAATLVDTGKSEEAISHFARCVELQPALGSALYRLHTLYRLDQKKELADQAFAAFSALKESRQAVLVGVKYGESGQYYRAIRTLASSGRSELPPPAEGTAPREVAVTDRPLARTRRPDGQAGRPALAVGDVNGDGRLDFVAGGLERDGVARAELYSGDSGGGFSRASRLDVDGKACALGDLDGDLDLDLVLADESSVAILANDGGGKFTSGVWTFPASLPGFPLRVLILDADSDWDLDVLICCQTVREGQDPGGAVVLLNNNRDGSFEDIAPRCGFSRLGFAPSEAMFADIDEDLDQDLLFWDRGRGELHVYRNDRAWRYRQLSPAESGPRLGGSSHVAVQSSGRDAGMVLTVCREGGLVEDYAIDPRGRLSSRIGPHRAFGGEALIAAGQEAVLSIPSPGGRPRWLVASAGQTPGLIEGEPMANWIAFDLNGPRDPAKADRAWSNLSGVGALVEVRAGTYVRTTAVNGDGVGSARSSSRVHVALPRAVRAIDYVRVLWPDGVLQSESGLAARKVHGIDEKERKPTSCPLLFAWNGERFGYVGDFLGVGGLGYLEAPDRYNRPDSTELVEIPDLKPRTSPGKRSGVEFSLRVVEPLEECTYLDGLRLRVVEHPAGVHVHPLEMFAIGGPRPGFEVVAYRESVLPVRVRDHLGQDVTEELRRIDRVYAENWKKDRRFKGVAEPHAIELDFGEGVIASRVLAESSRPVLFLYGYVEYGYSTSNFAASQTGLRTRAPTISVEREGRWEALREEWGFPGGTPRWMAVDLSGALLPSDRRLRVETNLEIYWDQVFLAAACSRSDPAAGLRTETLGASSATLRRLGFPRDGFPDGRHPRVYDYGDIIPFEEIHERELRPFPGRYTRYGDVVELLREADDRYAIFGPGDEIAVSFRADSLGDVPAGRERSFFLEASGWCKDTDLYTAHPESVEPLPFRDMPSYPLPPGVDPALAGFESDAGRRRAASEYHTREVRPLRMGARER